MTPRLEWPAQWTLKNVWNYWGIWVRNSPQISCANFLSLVEIYLCRWCLAFLEYFELEARSVEGRSVQQKDTKWRKNKDAEKKQKNKNSETAKDVGHSLVSRNLNFCVCSTKCPKMRCLWEERHAVML